MIKNYKNTSGVKFVAVQTTFEGHSTNTFKRAGEMATRYSLKIPVGHIGKEGERNPLMRSYRSGGTPWTVIIDRGGKVRYNAFRIEQDAAEKLVDQLLGEKAGVGAKPDRPATRPKTPQPEKPQPEKPQSRPSGS